MTDTLLADLQPHPKNYNQHSDAQIMRLAESLQRFGQPKEIVVWNGLIIAGHGLVQAAQRLDWKTLRARDMSKAWTETQALAFMAADNELARLADPDEAALAALLADLGDVDAQLAALAAGTEERLKELLATLAPEGPGGDPQALLDRSEALKEKYGVERGQLWQLGRHRLMCGDAYSEKDRKTILGDSSASMLHIDPPYGINIVQPRNGASAAAIGGAKPFTGGTSGTARKSGAAERSARAERVHVQLAILLNRRPCRGARGMGA